MKEHLFNLPSIKIYHKIAMIKTFLAQKSVRRYMEQNFFSKFMFKNLLQEKFIIQKSKAFFNMDF